MGKKIRIADLTAVPEGQAGEFVAEDRIIALYHVDGAYYAMDGVCPHAGGPLGEGALTGNIVTCPWHGWQFDVTTGKHCLNERLCHPTYSVFVEEDGIYIELPES
ncbi:Rieske (2Fe-2S) protein [Gimesia sp.]|uniref:Rieske (2Fe-2S) protein n=1 Tax=Gimesia sp. TaxID=2024833 RepID=UPI003A8F87B0